MTASWEPAGLATWLGFASDSTAVLGRSSQCSGTRFVEPPSEARLTVYGCEGGTGTVELRAGSITGRLLDSITITVRTPPTPRGELSATKTAIGVGETVTVSAVNVSPSGQSVYIVTNGQLDFARHGSCHVETGPRSSTRSARSWSLIGCSPAGSGSVTLKTRHNGQTLVLDSITIDVSMPPTPTPTVTPSGELSATKTAIDVGETVTVSAVNVSPSNQSVYIVTNGQLDFARHGSCHVETGPRSSTRSARSWSLIGCSPAGSGSVTLKTRHDGNTLVLDSITIDVSAAPTATPTTAPTATTTPVVVPTATTTTPVVEPPATTTDPVDPCRSSSDSREKCTIPHTPTPTPTATPRPVTLDTPGNFRSILGPGAGEIVLTWDAVAGATGYEVLQKKGRLFPLPDQWKPFPFDNFTATTTGTQAVVGGLKNDKSYDHRVRAVSAHGESEWAEVTTDLSERRKPGGLGGSVKPDGIGEITLQWGAVAEPARYEVQQKKVRDYWFDDWETLPFGNVDIRITGTQAVVSNLKYGITYEHQVKSVNAAGPSGWSASIKTDLSLIARGHQQDHTVRYLVAPMLATPEPGIPNPAIIIPPVVPTAVAAWNARISADGLLICKGETGSCDQTNADEKTVTIRLVTNSYACGGTACVQPPVAGLSNHRGHGDLIIEERPIDSTKPRLPHQLYRWTDDPSLNNEEVVEFVPHLLWKYVGAVLMHEFGHTLGLPHDVPAPSIMPVSKRSLTIQQNDIDYLRKIYSGHVRGE